MAEVSSNINSRSLQHFIRQFLFDEEKPKKQINEDVNNTGLLTKFASWPKVVFLKNS